MKNYKTLLAELTEALWPGSPEYKKKFGETPSDSGSRHKIDRSSGVVRATRKYDDNSGESDEPTKSREDAAVAPAKRGRGRPPGKYGSYKKKVKESLEILEALETEEEIGEFIDSLDEESFAELEAHFALDEAAMSHAAKTTMKHVKDATPGEKKAAKDIKPGIAGYRDRVAMLKSAEARGGVKEEAEIEEAAKWRQGYRASGHPSGFKHKSGEVGPLGGTWDEVPDYDNQKKVPVQRHRDEIDPLANRDMAGTSTTGKPLLPKNKQKNLKGMISRSAGKHGPVGRLPEGVDEVDEALKHPNHKVLDKNKNNKLDKEDFAILRGEKKAPMKEETTDDSIAMLAAFITKQAKGEA